MPQIPTDRSAEFSSALCVIRPITASLYIFRISPPLLRWARRPPLGIARLSAAPSRNSVLSAAPARNSLPLRPHHRRSRLSPPPFGIGDRGPCRVSGLLPSPFSRARGIRDANLSRVLVSNILEQTGPWNRRQCAHVRTFSDTKIRQPPVSTGMICRLILSASKEKFTASKTYLAEWIVKMPQLSRTKVTRILASSCPSR